MNKLILQYLQQGIEINFRLTRLDFFEKEYIKMTMTMITVMKSKKLQNSKVFSIEQFQDERIVEDVCERCRYELEQSKLLE